MKNTLNKLLILILVLNFFMSAYNQNNTKTDTIQTKKETTNTQKIYKVTVIELDSGCCIPCQKMQPIFKSIEEKYGN